MTSFQRTTSELKTGTARFKFQLFNSIHFNHNLRKSDFNCKASLESFALEHTTRPHTRSNAHAYDAGLLASALKLGEQRNNHACTSHAQWMPNRNGTTTWIKFLLGHAKLLYAVSGLARKSLIDFKDVNLVLLHVCLREGGWDCDSGANSHNCWGYSRAGEGEHASINFAAKFHGNIAAAQKYGCSSISDLARVSSSSSTTLLKGGL